MTSWIESEWNKVTSGANTAPVPTVGSSPKQADLPHTWSAPDVSQPGELHVAPSDLETEAEVLKKYAPALDEAVSEVEQCLNEIASLQGWQAADQVRTLIGNVLQQVSALAKDHSDVQTQAVMNLSRTAELYRSHEAATKKAMDGLGSAINAGTPPRPHTPLTPNPEAR